MLSQQKGRMLLERGAPGEEYEAGTVLDNNDAEDGSCVGSLACDNLSDAPPWGKAERDASTPQLVLEFSSGHYDPEQMGNGSEHEQLPIGTVFNNRYQITDMIGRGTYGAAWAAIDLRTLCKEVVIKARVTPSGQSTFSRSLQGELDAYIRIGAVEGLPGVPRIYAAGMHRLDPLDGQGRPLFVSYIAMQRLGENVWAACHKKVEQLVPDANGKHVNRLVSQRPSRRWIIKTGKGILQALASIHARGWIHRDVKTENMCFGGGIDDATELYAIDFGFAQAAYGRYCYSTYNEDVASYWGTPNYASTRALLRRPQCPRDDLEAFVYCMLEMESPNCKLPWNDALTTNSEAAEGWSPEQLNVMAQKKQDMWDQLCEQGRVPPYVQMLFDYIVNLEPWVVPDYSYVLLVLESGITGDALQRLPATEQYEHWPTTGCKVQAADFSAVTRSMLRRLRAAASEILPRYASSCDGRRPVAAATSLSLATTTSGVLDAPPLQSQLPYNKETAGARCPCNSKQLFTAPVPVAMPDHRTAGAHAWNKVTPPNNVSCGYDDRTTDGIDEDSSYEQEGASITAVGSGVSIAAARTGSEPSITGRGSNGNDSGNDSAGPAELESGKALVPLGERQTVSCPAAGEQLGSSIDGSGTAQDDSPGTRANTWPLQTGEWGNGKRPHDSEATPLAPNKRLQVLPPAVVDALLGAANDSQEE